jgi:hypothetical protein
MSQPDRERVLEEVKGGRNPFLPPPPGPRVDSDQGIVTVAWDRPVDVQLDFDLFRTDRRTGETSAELHIITTGPDGTVTSLHRTRVNLLSTTAQDRLARYLAERTKHLGLDWPVLLADATQRALTVYREGEPAILLRDAPDPPGADEMLLAPWARASGALFLFGDGGTGKSLFALAIAGSIQSGRELIEGFPPATTRRVAYLDWEWDAHVHRRRLAQLSPDAELPDLVYVACRLPIAEERDRLRRIIRQHGIEFLVIDSVALAAGGEPESAEVAVAFFGALRSLGLPTLCIAHVTNAAARSSADRPFGSAYWHNSARATWYVRRSDASGLNELVLGLFNRKANDAALAAPVGLRVDFAESIVIRKADVRDEPDLDSQRAVRFRIADELRAGPRLVADLAEDLGVPVDTVRKTLKRGTGTFVRSHRPDGIEQWGLLAHE